MKKPQVNPHTPFYNAGMSHKPDVAFYKARVHVRRVDGILAKAEMMGVA